MKFTAIFAAIVVAALPVLAAPTAEAGVEALEQRDLTLKVCTGVSGSGTCVTPYVQYNQCQSFGSLGLSGYQSWYPGSGTTCLWYTGGSCTGTQSGAVNSPGYDDVPNFWKYNTASWKCWI